MKIKNKVRTIEINPDLIMGFTAMCDPFRTNTYTISISMDNGRQENVTFFDLDLFQKCLDDLSNEVRMVRRYKRVVNGASEIDYKTRTKIKSMGQMQ